MSLTKQQFYVSLMDQYVRMLFFNENISTSHFCGYSRLTEGEFLTRPVMHVSQSDELCGLRQTALSRAIRY
jgi:hypothetical protein